MSQWTLFSNHGHVLVVLSRDPDARLRDVAQVVGITERAVQKIVRDLQDGGMISIEKQGRRNRYLLHGDVPLRHTLESHCASGDLLELINRNAPGEVTASPEPVFSGAKAPVAEPLPSSAPIATPPKAPVFEEASASISAAKPGEEVEKAPEPLRKPVSVESEDDAFDESSNVIPVNGNGTHAAEPFIDTLEDPETEAHSEPATVAIEATDQKAGLGKDSGKSAATPEEDVTVPKPTKGKKKARPDNPDAEDPGDQGNLF